MYLACPGGTSAKWMPRTAPRLLVEWLTCLSVKGCPTVSSTTDALNHSRNTPRGSGNCRGVNSQAPGILSSRTSTAATLEDLAEEGLRALLPGGGEDLRRVAALDDDAGVHEDRHVGHLAGEADLVGHDDHGHALLGQAAHDVEDLPDELRVEGAGRLVEQHELGPHRQRSRDGDALLLTAGQLGRVGVHLVA